MFGSFKLTLEKLWDLSSAPMFDLDHPQHMEYARFKDFDCDIDAMPDYINTDVLDKYRDADILEIAWCARGIAVKFYKGDEDE